MLTFAYDDNLIKLYDFYDCKLIAYHNLEILIDNFKNQKLDLAFIPVGTLPYLHNYEILAQAETNDEKTCLSAVLISSQYSNLEWKDKSFGIINKYCTTSYWGLLISLMSYLPTKSKINFVVTNGFVDLYNKTMLGQVDYAMVWDKIINKNIGHHLYRLNAMDKLPAPVLIASKKLADKNIYKLKNYLFNPSEDYFFNKFAEPNLELITDFQDNMQQAIDYFNLLLK